MGKIKNKLFNLIGIHEIEIAPLENRNQQFLELSKIIEENGFKKTHIFFNCINQYSSNSKNGKIWTSNYFDYSFNKNKSLFIGFFWINKNNRNEIERRVYEEGYSFKRT